MNKRKGAISNIRLGIFVSAGTLLFILSMYFIGDKQNLFGSTFELNVIFSNVNGLQKGNNVRYSGIDVGTVKRIEIVNDTAILVTMIIEDEIKKHIKKDAIAIIGTDGLMGNQLINISPGDPSSPEVDENDTLQTLDRLDSDKMLRRLGQTNTNVEIISDNLVEIIEKINYGSGSAGRLLNDSLPVLELQQTLVNMRILSQRMVNMMTLIENNISRGNGTIGTLLTDTVLANDMHQIVEDVSSAGKNLDNVTANLKVMIEDMKRENGMIHALTTDTIMVNNLQQSLKNIEEGSRGFSENMEALKHNFLFRRYFRKQEKIRKNEGK